MLVMKIIFSIQAAKQAQELYKKLDFSHRAQKVQKLVDHITLNKVNISESLSREEGLPVDWVTEELVENLGSQIKKIATEVVEYEDPEILLPTGLMGVQVGSQFVWSELSLLLANCLASGTAVIVCCPPNFSESLDWIRKTIVELQIPDNFFSILETQDESELAILAAHPGVQAFRSQSEGGDFENLYKAAVLKKKKIQFFTSAKNSCLIHPDFDYENNMEKILKPFLLGHGQLTINCHRLFVTQSHEKKFYEVLKLYMEKHSAPVQLKNSDHVLAWEKSVQQVTIDSGKILWGGKRGEGKFVQPVWTQDLSNCSEMQQHSIRAPFFIVTAVKYVHEMVKWANTGYYGHSAVVWAPEDKARNLAQNLNVGHVHLNKWSQFFDMGTPVKQSFWGNPDLKWSGSFFSDVKKLS